MRKYWITEEVNSYIYLRQMVTKDHDQEQELRHRIGLHWTAFCKLDSIMGNKKIPLRLKMKVLNECILLVIIVWEWNMVPQWNTAAENGHSTMQDGMNNANKHWCAGHVSQLKDNRSTKCVTEWCPWDHNWPRSCPKRHWWDNLDEAVGPKWSHVAKDQHCWTESREGFLQTGVKQNPDDDDTNVCTIWKDIGRNKEKEICLPNKESIRGHRCERTIMVAKCEIFMNCS